MRLRSSLVGISPVTFFSITLRRFLVLEVADDLAQSEHAHRDDDEIDSVCQFRKVEAETRDARADVGSDQSEQQPEHDHAERVEQRAVREHDRGDEAQHHQREVVGRAELQGDFGKRRGE